MAFRRPTAEFARRFYRMVVIASQWDACFETAERWAGAGIELFPGTPSCCSRAGACARRAPRLGAAPPPACPKPRQPMRSRARSARAIASRGSRKPAATSRTRSRSTRGLRSRACGSAASSGGSASPSSRASSSETALSSLRQVDHVYLAHLFLGRIQQDAGRLEEAIAEYRLAVALHPSALSAGVALSNALVVAGDAEGARLALRQGLAQRGPPPGADPHWDYLVVNAADLEALVEELHRESLK